MLIIKTIIWKSKIHWLWLFADQEIKKGELIWEFIFWLDVDLSEKKYKNLDKLSKQFFDNYWWKDKISKNYMLNIDNTRFINHSNNPNISHLEYKIIASKDIKIWEELLDNYSDFDSGLASSKVF
jgi:hypothetical protein